MTNAARAAEAASRNSSRLPTSSASSVSSASSRRSLSRSHSPDSHPSKRLKKSHSGAAADSVAVEQTPPPSPPATSGSDAAPKKIDLGAVKDDIVEAVITQLESTANRPHIIKDLATVLGQSLNSVQQSANPCAIISSRLGSYMKRPCWTARAPCHLAKELEPAHPRRTYYYLTTMPRQPLPSTDATQQSNPVCGATPSVSLTDDSGSDELEERRRELSPSPEIDLPRPDFYDTQDLDDCMPVSPIGSLPRHQSRNANDTSSNLPPLEKDEREFTQTADTLQKRKFNQAPPPSEATERYHVGEYGFRDDVWFSNSFPANLVTSPAMKPIFTPYTSRKDDDAAENWLKLNKLFEWGQGAESIEIDELDGLLDEC
ncbi:hypothetical protein GMORB2_6984 [Geosmithia morbida]|uniref:GDS1 winged helix domain-containing protein n=1 Tax=Geosmithia morbida TaxID=1094350 RepID=A0A9P4YVQ0_9HYPO|nr:uncharacterized protein GMORB2_6984 [Geosmithia morbida]KAF4122677.1 hypothetical protein GMORB2_6984 [Geosmithia morbida]